MMSNNPQNPMRAAVVEMIAKNADTITANLIQFMHRTTQDLVSGGVDCGAVAEAMFTVGAIHKLNNVGAGSMSVFLRDLADHFERLEMKTGVENSTDALRKH